MGLTALAAVCLAAGLDAAFAELPARVHPVALFGRVVGRVDRDWPAPGVVGAVVAVAFPLAAATLAFVVVTSVDADGFVGNVLAAAVAGVALFAVTSLRMLVSTASEVIDASERDPATAREAVVSLVGRDASALSPAAIRSAAVESAAENLADGLVAPLLAFSLGVQASLAVGVAAAVWVKAVNTLDSMLGYRTKPVGRASARLDDAVMWVPARVSAVLLALADGSPASLAKAHEWARVPASPNSGWPMATAATSLDVRLAKPSNYVLNPDAALPSVDAARTGVHLVSRAGALAFALAGVAAWF